MTNKKLKSPEEIKKEQERAMITIILTIIGIIVLTFVFRWLISMAR